jgi:hypothetical protein
MTEKLTNENNEKIQVTFNKAQLELIDSYKGIFGNSRAEVVRYIVTHWMFEKGSSK